MDLTLQAIIFTWTTYAFGDGSCSCILNDAAIINDTLIMWWVRSILLNSMERKRMDIEASFWNKAWERSSKISYTIYFMKVNMELYEVIMNKLDKFLKVKIHHGQNNEISEIFIISVCYNNIWRLCK